MPKISVIVPVYNGEKYLTACLDSLLAQTLQDIEIIAVDNGSTDGSAKILAEYAAKDERIKVLTLNPNRGPSGARNAALDIAKGKFIAFCDCDDTVPSSAYSGFIQALRKNKSDLAVGNYVDISESGERTLHNVGWHKEDYNSYLSGGALWNKVFRRSMLEREHVRFSTEFRYGENMLFLAEALKGASGIAVTGDIVYEYHIHANDNSALTSHNTADRIIDQVKSRTRYFSIIDAMQLPKLYSTPVSAALYFHQIWTGIDEPSEKELAFDHIQKFVSDHVIKDEKTFLERYKVTPEVFSKISFKDYMSIFEDREHNKIFKFSVVIPIYNTEEYLEETIRSVIDQSIGFHDNIQMILVNNATEDNSGAICKTYRDRYPNNVIYIVLEKNVGPAGAREAGKSYASGKYINFLDSDDKWEKRAFERAWFFLEAHPEVDLAAGRIRQFDANNNWHVLDYKFYTTRVVDIRSESEYIQLHVGSTFIRADVAKNYHFETDLHHAEDTQYLTQILLDKHKYGILKEAVFYYRIRKSSGSLRQQQVTRREYYFTTPVRVFKWILDAADASCPQAKAYVQHIVAYDLRWRSFSKLPDTFSEEEKEHYRNLLRDLLSRLDDKIIWQLRGITNRQKASILYFKYGEDFKEHIQIRYGCLYADGIGFRRLNNQDVLKLEILDVNKNKLTLWGSFWQPVKNELARFALLDDTGREYPVQIIYEMEPSNEFTVAPDCMKKYCFSAQVPLEKVKAFWFAFIADDGNYPIPFSNGRRFPLTRGLTHSHFRRGTWHFHIDKYKLVVKRRSFIFDLKEQFKLWEELFQKKKRTSLACHIYMYFLSFLPKRKEIWIFSDRTFYAGDNGESLFKYVDRVHNRHIKAYFSVRSTSPDYKRLKKSGYRVLPNESKRFKLLYLHADKIISSYFESKNIDPLHKHEEYLKDLIYSKRIYLQHGIIKDDCTADNGKILRAINGFVTSSAKERESLCSLPYGYRPEEVWLTGLARYDELFTCIGTSGKTIFIAPTWRNFFSFRKWGSDGIMEDPKNEEFQKTDFYKFYSDLLKDERLHEVMSSCGYNGILRLHPVMRHFSHYFESNDVFAVENDTWGYKEDVARTALFVTDYSSTAFDYAYTYRPCIYAQFDRERFVTGHTYKPGYFDYERDGFGPVCYDYESTVQAIISAIENGCVMEEKYRKRAEAFFAYRDGKNCERIYNKILEMDREA